MSYVGSGTTWTDLSGNGNSGSLVNGPTFNNSNQGNIVFNGTNQYINCGQGIAQVGSWTLCGYLNPSALTNARIIIARSGGTDTSFAQNYVLSIQNSKFLLGTSVDSYKNVTSSLTPTTSTWYHAAGTYNTTTKTLTLYVNGNLQASTTLTTDPPTAGNQYVQVGCSDGVTLPANYLSGNIAQVQIYNRALSAQEIAQNYNALKARFGLT
jgi:hypothetical protein